MGFQRFRPSERYFKLQNVEKNQSTTNRHILCKIPFGIIHISCHPVGIYNGVREDSILENMNMNHVSVVFVSWVF